MPAHHRYFTIPQPLTRYDEFEYEPTYAWNVPLKPDIFVPETVHTSDKQQVPSTEPEMFVVEPQNTTTELQTTQTESQITTSTTTTSPTVLAAAAGLQTNVVDTDPISTKVPENMHLYTSHPKLTPPTISFHHASPEEHESDDEHESDEEHISRPDPFDGIFQPILSSSSSQSSSTTSSQPLDEDDEDNNGNFYHSSTSAPRDIPRTDQRRIPTTVDPTSGLTKRLLSFESRMLAIQRSQLRLEQAAERESEVEQPNEGSDSLPELCRTTSVATIEELQTPSNITSYVPQQIVTSEVSVPSYTQITSELGTAGESQPQPQNIPTDRIADNRDAKLQQQLTTSSYQSNINTFASLHQIDLSAQHQQHQSTSEAEPTKPSRTYEHLVFPEPAPPTPPPRVIFTPYGPKIVNFSPTSSLEGATAALSPSSSVKKKKSKVVTFDEKCTYWSSQSTIEAGTCCKRFPKQRSIRQRSTRPPPLRSTSVEKEQQVPSSPQNRGTQQIALPPQQDANLYQVSSYPQQLRRQSHTLESRRRRLAQRKRLRRSFSAPRNGAVWPLCSLVREPPYFIYKVLRRASASSRQVFGRRFLSVHSSAEDLYDEAAEKAFPDPWAPRGSRTMHNTFPITPWLPKEKPRVPWIRFQWPYRRSS